MIPVKVILKQGEAALVEWLDEEQLYNRATIPVEKLDKGACDLAVLNAGIPYGELWESVPLPQVDPAIVAQELRRNGIWTEKDLLGGSASVRAALMKLYIGPVQKALINHFKSGGK
jgi:hypothetical protein